MVQHGTVVARRKPGSPDGQRTRWVIYGVEGRSRVLTLPVEHVTSMYAQIVNGVEKERSGLVTDEESFAMWDKIAGEVAEMKAANPNIVFSIPNEMPHPDEPDAES